MPTSESWQKPSDGRRNFLITGVAIVCSQFQLASLFGQKGEGSEFAKYRAVAKKFDVEVITTKSAFPVRTTHGFIHGKVAALTTLQTYEPLFEAEFNLYPKSFVKATQLKRIVICEDLSFDGQRRSAVPDFEHLTLYLDAKRGDYHPVYQRKVIHHEFFHLVDFADDGKVYEDPNWNNLNSNDFRYGAGGKNAQDNESTSVLTNLYPGFLNHYSTTGIEEDKAEIFANLMVEPRYILTHAKSDMVLGKKVDSMKALLLRFCPDVNPEFWKKLNEMK